jgi:hypothetical protein
LLCSSATACQVCTLGYSVSNNTCKATCNIPNCSICSSYNACLLCSTGYAVSADFTFCSILCGDPYCSVCSSSTSCSLCVPGYSKGSNGKCISSCQQG